MEQRPILVVEDDDDLRETLAYNLRVEGYETLLAADGVAALELARRQPVALVILDVMLPRLDGLSVLRQLRARPETAALPVLMLTARAEESDMFWWIFWFFSGIIKHSCTQTHFIIFTF